MFGVPWAGSHLLLCETVTRADEEVPLHSARVEGRRSSTQLSTRARSKGSSAKRKDGFLAKNPPNEITPKTPTHAHFALLADGSPAGGSQAKGGSYHKSRSRYDSAN